MFTNQIIRHKDADASFLDRVIALKQSAWPYPKESQMAWVHENLKEDDLHVILMLEDKDVAYLNLCDVRCEINGVETQCKGIGNVCAAVKGMGYGNKLMELTNTWLKTNNYVGLLFCHHYVESFYSRCGWMKIDNSISDISGITPEILTYAYNIQKPILSISYRDRLF